MNLYKVQRDLTGTSIMGYREGHTSWFETRGEKAKAIATMLKLEPLTKTYVMGDVQEDGIFVFDPTTQLSSKEWPDW